MRSEGELVVEGDEERKRSLKRRDGKRERDVRKKETFSFFHLPDYDKWPGLSLVCAPPALSLGLPSHKRLFQGERTPQILLFVPDSAQPTPQRSSFNHGEAGKARVRFNAQEHRRLILCICDAQLRSCV